VLLAALARPGVCTQLLDEIEAEHDLVSSQHILDEVERKLRHKFHFPPTLVASVVTRLKKLGIVVQPAVIPRDSCRDPENLPILGTAIAGEVELLVTVDKDLLCLGEFRGIPIIRPGEFWKRTRS
jgi:putative PIN family toxin of toxin-antitoxin system